MTPEQTERAIAAIEVYEYAEKFPTAYLNQTQEFQAELARQMIHYGQEHALNPSTDLDIAARMYLAGYQPAQVAEAVENGSLNAVQSEEVCSIERGTYGTRVAAIVPHTRNFGSEVRKITEYKIENGLTGVYRLDRLGLATVPTPYQRMSTELLQKPQPTQAMEL